MNWGDGVGIVTPFLHPQPEDLLSHGDRLPLILAILNTMFFFVTNDSEDILSECVMNTTVFFLFEMFHS